jgi:hypothetical protein
VKKVKTMLFFCLLAVVTLYFVITSLITRAKINTADNLIALTDQGSKKILILDPKVSDWNSNDAIKWSWYPNASNGFETPTPGWRLPSDVKLRNSSFYGGQVMLVCDSDGFAAIVPYPAGNTKKWSINLNVGPNPHAVELLPDGNIAIAASTGGWVRIYTASQGTDSNKYVQYDLAGAHGVLWDPKMQLLWAVGDKIITGLKIGGTAEAPTIQEDTSLTTKLIVTGGHDLRPVYGDTDRLWVTTNAGVVQFIKSTKSWDVKYEGYKILNRPKVKSISNDPKGKIIVQTKPNNTLFEWATNTVDIFILGKEPTHETRTRKSSAIYKARIWNADYQ